MLIELGNVLKKEREERGASLTSVAGPANISAAYLHKLERGVINSPSPRVLARLAVALDVDYLRLMELAGYLDEEQLARASLREPSPRPHPLAGRKLTTEEWRAVDAIIKMLIAQRGKEGPESDTSA
ncbi:MAG: helix-turn-helix domain-containing protein [Actinobacteria bacterium]|nr:helix-turn-helix domain-containing protein [Actinomycetota bacterium]